MNDSELASAARLYDLVSSSVYHVAMPALCCLGIPANLLVIFVLTRRGMAQRSVNHHLLMLAVMDLTFTCGAFLFSLSVICRQFFPTFYGFRYAIFVYFLFPASGRAALLIVFFVAVLRFLAIMRPWRCVQWNYFRRRFEIISGLISSLPFAYYAVRAAHYRVTLRDNGTWVTERNAFGRSDRYLRVHGTIAEVLFRLCPLAGILVVNLAMLIFFNFYASRDLLRLHMEPRQMKNYLHRQARLTCMLRIVCAITVLCLAPGAIGYQIGVHVGRGDTSPAAFKLLQRTTATIALLLEVFNASANFWIYTLMCASFRRHVRNICSGWVSRERHVTPGPNTLEMAMLQFNPNSTSSARGSRSNSRASTLLRRDTRSLMMMMSEI